MVKWFISALSLYTLSFLEEIMASLVCMINKGDAPTPHANLLVLAARPLLSHSDKVQRFASNYKRLFIYHKNLVNYMVKVLELEFSSAVDNA